MKQYIVVKEFDDGTFTTEFFSNDRAAKLYANKMRALNVSGIVKSVTIYVKTDY